MAVLGVASITPTLPRIATVFDLTPERAGLVVSMFTLPGVILTPVFGVLSDRIGRIRVLIPSLLLFAVAGTACAFARDFGVLLALRFVQGIGVAALGVINLTLLGDLFRGNRLPTAMGYNASVLSIGTGVYPALGGALALTAWYYPFALPLLAVPVAGFVWWRLRVPHVPSDERFTTYLRGAAGEVGRPAVIGCFLAGLVTFILIYGAFLTYLPFLLAERFEASPARIGLLISAASVSTAIVSARLGRLVARFGERRLMLVGFAIYVISLLALPVAGSTWTLLAAILLFGAANGINIPSMLSLLMSLAPAQYRAAFMAVNGSLFRLGQTVGPLLAALALRWWGLDGVYLASAGAAAVTLAVVAGLTRRPQPAESP